MISYSRQWQWRSCIALTLALGILMSCADLYAHGKDTSPDALTGDPSHGHIIYQRCIGCHSLERSRTGPRHCGLIGRRAGSLADFDYSVAMKLSGIVWTRENLDAFLESPLKFVPGTSMGFAGIDDRQERVDLIAYIVNAGRQQCRPLP